MSEVSPITRDENKQVMNKFIFDDDKIQRIKSFTQLKINEETFGYGIFLPKDKEIIDRRTGEVVGKEQIWSPVIVTSNREIIEATQENQQKYKIKFESVPENLKLRWSLESIKAFLEGDDTLPEINPKELFEKIRSKYEYYIFERNPEWYKFDALWDMGTYLFQIFNNYPIREKRGISGTGKTQDMRVSRNISFNASEIMVNPSASSLFRETHDKRLTKYFDEAEKLIRFNRGQIETDDRIELINGSYSKGSTVPRVEKIGNKFVTIYYSTYSPTMICSIKGLSGATETRAITNISTKNLDNDERGERDPDAQEPEWQILKDYLYLFGLTHWKKIEKNYRDTSLFSDLRIKKRDLQIWKPILSIAEVISHDLFNEMVSFAERISIQKREDFISEDSYDFRLLSIVKDLLQDSEIIRPKRIREKYQSLFGLEECPREKAITTRLDHLGFKELRSPKDREGIKYIISEENFFIIVSPICPELIDNSSHSSHSSQLSVNSENNVTNPFNSVTKSDESVKEDVTNVTKMTNVTKVFNKGVLD